MAEINSVGGRINKLMDAIGLHDSIGDAVGAIVDLQRGDRAGFIKNMNDLYEDVNKFLEKKLLGKNFINKIAKSASVPIKKSKGLKKAIKLLTPIIQKFGKLKGAGILNPQLLASTIILSKVMDMAKNLKNIESNTPQGIQIRQSAEQSPVENKGSVSNNENQTTPVTKIQINMNTPEGISGSIEERIMLALTGALKDNRDEMENLLRDIEKLSAKTNMTDKEKNDFQVLQIKLQVAISRRNEMVSTLSNIMKTFNDMNMATIRNIRI